MQVDLDSFYQAQEKVASRYDGQLTPSFQDALEARYGGAPEGGCVFSHTIELPSGAVVRGAWDLRDSEAAHLGAYDLEGKRVLEYTPGCGWLTAYVAPLARETVAVELPPGAEDQLAPSAVAGGGATPSARDLMDRLRRSWWFTKQVFNLDARIAYVDIYRPPSDLGMFDVSLFAGALYRLPHPFLALQGAAAITRDAIIVTEPVTKLPGASDPSSPIAAFAPAQPGSDSNPWWNLSPAAVCRMLLILGFRQLDLTVHTPPKLGLPLFTVVARRGGA